MLLRTLSLANFKNIAEASLELSPKINCFLGDNGMGKSNLLDAVYFLSYCKSFTGAPDAMLIRRGDDFATLRGVYTRRGIDEELTAGLRPGQSKVFRRGGKAYRRLAEHIGAFPAVLLSPADADLAAGEPAERRRFIDQIISQSSPRYLDALLRYNTALEQRNKLLRDESTDIALFQVLEIQLEMAAEYIVQERRHTIDALVSIFDKYYTAIAANGETATLEYSATDYPEGLAAHLAASRHRDMALHHTASGPHRHDIIFSIDGMPVRRTASQGQTKTFTTALRFAQYELLKTTLGIKPLLLLDDIFDKLDAGRVARIMEIVSSSPSDVFGQIFITDTNRRHLDDIVADLPAGNDSYRLWHVEGGAFSPLSI